MIEIQQFIKITSMLNKKLDPYYQWRQNHKQFYHFIYENFLDWPVTSIQWGPLVQQGSEYITQRMFFSCKTDGIYNPSENNWTNNPNYIVVANVELPKDDHYLISDLKSIFNYDAAKKHPNIKVKQIISHPGQITVVRSSPMNRKLMASKSDSNEVYLWLSEKYKSPQPHFTNTPEITLQTTSSPNHNYAMRFAPSLPKIITASENKLQLFDIDNPSGSTGGSNSTKRQLGSVLNSYIGASVVKPLMVLEGHKGIEDVTFKSNEICLSAGQDQSIGIGVWDLRIGQMQQKLKSEHEGDINTISVKGNYILSGGQDHKVSFIDDRKGKCVESFKMNYPIHSIQFNSSTNHFAVGKDYLSIYDLDQVLSTHQMEPIFTHHGLRGNINEFDWNEEAPMTIAQTYQDPEPDAHSSQGGIVHIYRPLDLVFQSKEKILENLESAFDRMSEDEKKKLLQSL